MVYICTKFHENILNGIRVMERTREVNRRTDRQTDGQRARHNTTRLRRAYKNHNLLESENHMTRWPYLGKTLKAIKTRKFH